MKSNIFLKALCVTALLSSPTFFTAMELAPQDEKKIELGAIDNKTSHKIRLEQITANNTHSLFALPVPSSYSKEVAAKTMTDLMVPVSFEQADNNSQILNAKYKISSDNNEEIFAHLTLNRQEGILKGVLTKNQVAKPIYENLIKLNHPQQSKMYVIFRATGDNFDKSKIELSADRPKLEIEKKSRTTSKPNFHFYIPGLFRW